MFSTLDPTKSDQCNHLRMVVTPCEIPSCVDHLRSNNLLWLTIVPPKTSYWNIFQINERVLPTFDTS
jgi:hypothetical protein